MSFIMDLIDLSRRQSKVPPNEDLCRLAQEGDESARELLVIRNLPFAMKKAKRYAYKGESLEEVFSDAIYGLTLAIRRFHPDRGVKFTTAADFSIRQAIRYERRRREPFWVTQYARDHKTSPSGKAAQKALHTRQFRLVGDPPAPETHVTEESEPLYAALRALPEIDYAILMKWAIGSSYGEICRTFKDPDCEHHVDGLTEQRVKTMIHNTLEDLKVAYGEEDGKVAIEESKLSEKQKTILATYRTMLAEGDESPRGRDICKRLGMEERACKINSINKILRKLTDRNIIQPRNLKRATMMSHIDECLERLKRLEEKPTRTDLACLAGVTRIQINNYVKHKRQMGCDIRIPDGPSLIQERTAREAKACAEQMAENYEKALASPDSDEAAKQYAAEQLTEALEWMKEEGEGSVLTYKKIRYVYLPYENSFSRLKLDNYRYPLHHTTKMKDLPLLMDRTSVPRGILHGYKLDPNLYSMVK